MPPSSATPLIYESQTPRRALPWLQFKRSQAIDHTNGEFCDFFILSTIQLGMTIPDLPSSAIALLYELNTHATLPWLQSKA